MGRTTSGHEYSPVLGPRLPEEKEVRLLSYLGGSRQVWIYLLFTTRAAASVGYTELPLTFQKDRFFPVPPVSCLNSNQSCLSPQRTDQAPVPINPTQTCHVGIFQKDSSSVSGKQRDRECHGCCQLPDHTWLNTQLTDTCPYYGPVFSAPLEVQEELDTALAMVKNSLW